MLTAEKTGDMIELLTLLLSSLSDESEARDRRGRLHELRGRLGLREEPERRGPSARIAWALKQWPELTRDELLEALQMAGVRTQGNPGETDALIGHIARWLGDPMGTDPRMGFFTLRPIRDWWLATRADLSGLSWIQAGNEAERWHAELAAGLAEVAGQMVPPGEIVYSWDDGWTVQKIRDPNTVQLEGQSMQNCLAEGLYDEEIESGNIELYSLRGPPNARGWSRPAVTMALEPLIWGAHDERESPDMAWVEVKGRQNDIPAPKHRDRTLQFIVHANEGRLPDNTKDDKNILLMIDRSSRFFPLVLESPDASAWYADDVDGKPMEDTRASALRSPAASLYYAEHVDDLPRYDTRMAVSEDYSYSRLYERWEDSIRFTEYNQLDEVEKIEEELVRLGGRKERGTSGVLGPSPLKHVILSVQEDDVIWVHWIEAADKGAFTFLKKTILGLVGPVTLAGETAFDETMEFWLHQGAEEIGEEEAADIYEWIEPGNRYFKLELVS